MKNPTITVTFSCDSLTAEKFFKDCVELELNKSETLRTLIYMFMPYIKANPDLIKTNDPYKRNNN